MARITLILGILTAIVALLGGFQLALNEWRLWRARIGKTGRWLGVILALCLLPAMSEAACTGSSPTWNATVDIASVKSCISQAANGDTVNIAAGTATWPDDATGLGIGGYPQCGIGGFDQSFCDGSNQPKYLTIQGAGIGQIIINDGINKNGLTPNVFRWWVKDGGLSRITGVEIRGSSGAGTCISKSEQHSVLIAGTSSQLRVDHNKFVTHGGCDAIGLGFNFFNAGLAGSYLRGVFDHNYIDVSGVGDGAQAGGYCGHFMNGQTWGGIGTTGDNSWAQPNTLGTAEAIFFEDNTFFNDQSVDTLKFCFDGWQGQRITIRYNLFLGGTAINNHGADSGVRSARQYEIYENRWLGTDGITAWNLQGTSQPPPTSARGGVGVVFNNTITTTNGTITPTAVHTIGYLRAVGQQGNLIYGFCTGSNAWDQNTVGQSGWRCLDQTGAGVGDMVQTSNYAADGAVELCASPWPKNATLSCTVAWPRQAEDPTYVWGNILNGSAAGGDVDTVTYPMVVLGRDLINGTRPGYTAYTYPHPLVPSTATPSGLRIAMRMVQMAEWVLPVLGVSWHFRRAILSGVLATSALVSAGITALPLYTTQTYYEARQMAAKVVLAALPKDKH